MPTNKKRLLLSVVMGVLLLSFFSASMVVAAEGKIDINTATVKELQKLDGIGKTIATRIVEYRETNTFDDINEIRKVKGVGKATFEKIKEHITAGVAAETGVTKE